MLAAAGASPQSPPPLDGIDLLPVLASGLVRDRTIFWRSGRERQGAVRRGPWKFLRDGEEEYLFDLVLDPGERTNRKDEHASVFRTLKASYAAWEREMLPVPRPPSS